MNVKITNLRLEWYLPRAKELKATLSQIATGQTTDFIRQLRRET